MPNTASDQEHALRVLETTSDAAVTGLLTAMAGPAEDIELSPDYFYNWANWSNN